MRTCGRIQQTATQIDCTFGYIAPGDYTLSAFSGNCGSIETPAFSLVND